MNAVDLVGVGTALSLALGFLVIRRVSLYSAYAAVVVACGLWLLTVFPERSSRAEGLFLALGLMLNGFGLSMVRVMLKRSVSLAILARCGSGFPERFQDDAYLSRADELKKYHLATTEGALYRLTPFGRAVARIAGMFLGE